MKIAQKHEFLFSLPEAGAERTVALPVLGCREKALAQQVRPWVLSAALETEMTNQEADHMHLSVCEVKPKKSPCGEFPLLLWIQGFSLCWGHFSSCSPLFAASCPHMPGSSFRPVPLPSITCLPISLFFAFPICISLTWVVFEYFSLRKAKQIEKSSSLV